MDLIGKIHQASIKEHNFILVVIDYFTKWVMSLKVIHFQSIFLIDFYLKKTDLCAEMWNNSPNCCAAGN